MSALICKTLTLFVDQATVATLRQPRTKVVNLSYIAPIKRSINLRLPNRSCFYRGTSKPNLVLFQTQKDPQIGGLGKTATAPKDGRSMVVLFFVEDEEFNKVITKMLSRHKDLWSVALGTIKATLLTINLSEKTRPIRLQHFCTRQRSRQLLCAHFKKQLEALLVELAQSELGSPIVLIPKKNSTFSSCVDYPHLNAGSFPDSYLLPSLDDYIDDLVEA